MILFFYKEYLISWVGLLPNSCCGQPREPPDGGAGSYRKLSCAAATSPSDRRKGSVQEHDPQYHMPNPGEVGKQAGHVVGTSSSSFAQITMPHQGVLQLYR